MSTYKFPDTEHATLPREGGGYAVFLKNRCLSGSNGAEIAVRFAGISVKANPAMPTDAVALVKDGEVVGGIVNIGPEAGK